jgi:hypothetical protein
MSIGINYYYFKEIIKGELVIDFVNTDSLWKKYILEIVVPFNTFKGREDFLKNRYFYFSAGEFKGAKTKSSKIKKMKIVDYLELHNAEVAKPIINIF